MPTGTYLAGSFRDPAGHVFTNDGEFYREVTGAGLEDYCLLRRSELDRELLRNGLLVPFEEIELTSQSAILHLQKLSWVSYPYEWCFGQLRDAALLTLEVLRTSLQHGMILKDASAYNIAFRGAMPVFIDHGSFTVYRENQPWQGYRQFVMHFLGPLLLLRQDDRYRAMLRSNLDGLELDFISKNLPWSGYFRIPELLHVHLHARFQQKYADSHHAAVPKEPKIGKNQLLWMISRLYEFISSLKSPRLDTEWGDYYNDTNYSSAAFIAKKALVGDFLGAAMPERTIDLGANRGEFTMIAARYSNQTIAADIDPAAIGTLYAALRTAKNSSVHPMIQDLNNPSPGLGLFNAERLSFFERAKADAVLGLALAHHLRVGGNWPLERIAELFARLAPRALIEFVPREDSQFQRLLRSRPDIYHDWTLPNLIDSLKKHYRQVEPSSIPESGRILLRTSGLRGEYETRNDT
ncbi:MAG: SAM-dependent methyltransferase [Victivallaceae bacterium]